MSTVVIAKPVFTSIITPCIQMGIAICSEAPVDGLRLAQQRMTSCNGCITQVLIIHRQTKAISGTRVALQRALDIVIMIAQAVQVKAVLLR